MSWLARLFPRWGSDEKRIRVAAKDALERADEVTDRLQAHADQRHRDAVETRHEQMQLRREMRRENFIAAELRKTGRRRGHA